jgi:hypothetical protein
MPKSLSPFRSWYSGFVAIRFPQIPQTNMLIRSLAIPVSRPPIESIKFIGRGFVSHFDPWHGFHSLASLWDRRECRSNRAHLGHRTHLNEAGGTDAVKSPTEARAHAWISVWWEGYDPREALHVVPRIVPEGPKKKLDKTIARLTPGLRRPWPE